MSKAFGEPLGYCTIHGGHPGEMCPTCATVAARGKQGVRMGAEEWTRMVELLRIDGTPRLIAALDQAEKTITYERSAT